MLATSSDDQIWLVLPVETRIFQNSYAIGHVVSIFDPDSESVLGLVKFGHFTGQIDVKPVFRGQKWKIFTRSMNHDMWPLIRSHFCRRFRIWAWFYLIRSFYRSKRRKTGFSWSKMKNFYKIDESWHVTPYSIAFLQAISNLGLVLSDSVILPVKTPSNRSLWS